MDSLKNNYVAASAGVEWLIVDDKPMSFHSPVTVREIRESGATSVRFPTHDEWLQIVAAKSCLDEQVGGDHYKKLGDYQPWEVLRHWLTPEEYRGYMKGNAIVYLARERDKGGALDIRKALHTLQGLMGLGGIER